MFKNRKISRAISIGNVTMGENAPILLQSMTNTDTNDVEATVSQTIRLVQAGAQLVRITVPTMKEVPALRQIKSQLRTLGYDVPLIADVHFFPKVAEACAEIVEKVRVNPGNYVDKRVFNYYEYSDEEYQAAIDKMAERAQPLLELCKKNGTALRIGVNHGSICDRVVSRYGNTPLAMAMSAMEWVEICEKAGFRNFALSMKSSNPKTMIESVSLLVDKMGANGTLYPLHLGVTEAGNGWEARAKSAVGIGALLLKGIGDTIRVSLTEKPENEIPFAKLLVSVTSKLLPDCYRVDNEGTLYVKYETKDKEELLAAVGSVSGYVHFLSGIKNLKIENNLLSELDNQFVSDYVLQACRIKMNKAEFISCPSCGRTQYDIETVLGIVKERFAKYVGVKIGVMGCVVNGPGEMADADFGVVGTAGGDLIVYRGKEKMTNPMPIEEALDKMESLIQENFNL